MDDSELRLVTQEMAGWGFSVFFPHQPERPGFRVLAVAMRPRPTYAHYDPERMRIALRRGRIHPELANVRFDTSLPRRIGFGPGMVVLGDRVDKRVSFYTFGGTLEAVRNALPRSGTLYALTSPAPILPMSGTGKVEAEEQLASSSEALMARMRAYQRCHGFDPDAQLAQLDPQDLYCGCIESLYNRYCHSSALMMTFPNFYKLLQRERTCLLCQSSGRIIALERQLEHISGRGGLTGD